MKAAISGAGIAGLATALALAQRGWQVHVVEKARGLRASGYMIDFFGPGYEAAERMGVIAALEAAGQDIDAVDFVDGQGRPAASINYALARQAAHGRLFPIMRGDVERVLHSALPDTVSISYGTEITGVAGSPGGATVTLSDGSRLAVDLLVGAGGIHSKLRAMLFGPEDRFLRFLRHHTAAYLFESDTVREALEGRFRIMGVPGRQAGFYDTGSGHLAAFFVHRSDDARVPKDPRAALRQTYGDLDWIVPEALAAMPPAGEIYYDLVAQVVLGRWSSGRAVLLGDAAYAVSLLAGQGASLAIAGAAMLAEELDDGSDISGGLQRFEERLRPLIQGKQAAGRRTANWFVPETPLKLWLRNAALNVASWPPVMSLLGGFVGFGSKGFTAAHK